MLFAVKKLARPLFTPAVELMKNAMRLSAAEVCKAIGNANLSSCGSVTFRFEKTSRITYCAKYHRA